MTPLLPRLGPRPVAPLVAVAGAALGLGLLVAPSAAAPVTEARLVTQSAPAEKPKDPKPKRITEYVALGDSWTADVVLVNGDGLPDTTHAPIDCAQSHRNYPKLVAPAAAAPVTEARLVTQSAPAEKPKGPKPKRITEYVALGDSWTADVVLVNGDGLPDTTHAPMDCAQSHRNYPKLVAKALGVKRFRDASCGSATTDDFANPQTGLPIGGTNPPQFDRLTRRTKLVTVGIGGNDAGIASAGLDCLNLLPVDNPLAGNPAGLPFGGCRAKYTAGGTDELSERIKASEPKLVAAFKAIRKISPKARILAIDYLSVVPDHACYPRVPSTDTDMAYIHAKFLELNKMVKRAARKGGAEFVDTYTPSLGHDLCTGPRVRYAEVYGPSVNDPAVGVPAHPNAAGARAQARIVLDHLRSH